jgi:hypothetical protein
MPCHCRSYGNKERLVKSKYAGVTLDWYDDELATLKAKFPTADQLPDIIKEADVRPAHRLANEQFALVALDEGHVLRKYACHDPGTTAMSVIYFMEHGDKLPEGAQKMAAVNLVGACLEHDLAPPDALTKAAGLKSFAKRKANELAARVVDRAQKYVMRKFEEKGGFEAVMKEVAKGVESNARQQQAIVDFFKKGSSIDITGGVEPGTPRFLAEMQRHGIKIASQTTVVDLTGKSPPPKIKTARPTNDEDYAVVLQDGSRHYPIDTWDRVKLAEDYYQENRLRMEPRVRRQYAVKLAAKSIQLGYPLDYEIFEKGACTYAKSGQMKAAIEMRKVACAPGDAREWLDELFEKRAHMAPAVYASCLHRFDVESGLDRGWDHVVLDPWESTFGINKVAEVVWEQGADRVTDDQLQNLAQNQHSGMDELFTHEVSKEFIKDPVGIFNSMPDPQKKIIARLANDLSSQGGSEVAVVG